MKSLLYILFKLLNFAKFSKILLPAVSIILSIGTYTILYGWSYVIGFIGLIFIHEMGHYIAARQSQLRVGLPMFVPFVGAWVELKDQPVNAEIEAYVAYAGPFVGTMASFILYFLGKSTGSGLLLALSQAGFLINLFNLIPLYPLDGGRISSVISPRLWLFGAPLLIAVWLYQPSPMLIVIACLSFPQLVKAWKYDPQSPENKDYYGVKGHVRFEYAFLYLSLAIVLALMINK